ELESAVASASACEHAELDLLADRVPLAREARRERQLETAGDEEDARLHAPATSSNVVSSSPKTRSGAYSATEGAAAARRRSRSSSSSKNRVTASASASVSPAATSSPLTPSC